MIDRLTTLAHRRPRRVIAVALVLAVAAAAFGGSVAGRLYPYGADDPATGSAKAKQALERANGLDPDVGLVALVRTGAAPGSRASRSKVERVAAVLRSERDVGRVTTFYGSRRRALLSRDRRSQIVTVNFKAVDAKREQDAAKRLSPRLDHEPGVQLGGFAAASAEVNEIVESDLRRAELLDFPLLFLLSLLFFRSAVAALLPLLVGGLAIMGTFFVLRLASGLTDVSVFALNLTTGLGLELAIDYSLFMVAAALLFSVAIGAFATSRIFIKENGVGTALTVLIDASLVRALLVPALMELLGRWNWWAPRPLRALHRRIGLSEGDGEAVSPAGARTPA